MAFVREFWQFLRVRKKFWLLPIVIVLFLTGLVLVLSQGVVLAPLLYTVF